MLNNQKKEGSSGLPKVLIATNVDAEVCIGNATYDLAITLNSNESGPNNFHLRACSKSIPDQSGLEMILNRCQDLIHPNTE